MDPKISTTTNNFWQGAATKAEIHTEFISQLKSKAMAEYLQNSSSQSAAKSRSWFKLGKQQLALSALSALSIILSVSVITVAVLNSNSATANVAYAGAGVQQQAANGEWQTMVNGTVLKPGLALKSEAENGVINFENGSVLRLGSDTHVTLSQLDKQNVEVKLIGGEVYARVQGDATFTVALDDQKFTANGTAFSLTNKEDRKALNVYESSVKSGKSAAEYTQINSGYAYSYKDGAYKQVELNLDEVKQDKFIVWNVEQDKQKYQSVAGVLTKLPQPTLEITAPVNGSKTTNPKVLIMGKVSADTVKVIINDKQVTLADNKFSQEVELKEGENKFMIKAFDSLDQTAQKELKVIKETIVPTSSSSSSAAPVTPKLTLSATKKSNGIQLSWSVTGFSAPQGFKVLKSTSANPTYGSATAVYVDKSSTRSYFWEIADGQTYHFRVCRYTGSGCDMYSNDITVKAPLITDYNAVTLNFDDANNKLTWTSSGGPGKGFKIYKNGTHIDTKPAGTTSYPISWNATYKVCGYATTEVCSDTVDVTTF